MNKKIRKSNSSKIYEPNEKVGMKKKQKKQKKEKVVSAIVKIVALTFAPVAMLAKAAITVASNLYLGSKGYDVSRDMFNKSMYYPSGNISKNTQNQIQNKSQNISQVHTAINSCIAKNSGSNSFTNCLGYDDAEMLGDLFYSIQHVDIRVSGKRINDNTLDITINMSDKYDFEWRDIDSFADLANDLGYFMQESGLLKTYHWFTSYTIKYRE